MKETILWLVLAVAVIAILWKLVKHKKPDSSISRTEPDALRRSFSTPVEPAPKPAVQPEAEPTAASFRAVDLDLLLPLEDENRDKRQPPYHDDSPHN